MGPLPKISRSWTPSGSRSPPGGLQVVSRSSSYPFKSRFCAFIFSGQNPAGGREGTPEYSSWTPEASNKHLSNNWLSTPGTGAPPWACGFFWVSVLPSHYYPAQTNPSNIATRIFKEFTLGEPKKKSQSRFLYCASVEVELGAREPLFHVFIFIFVIS